MTFLHKYQKPELWMRMERDDPISLRPFAHVLRKTFDDLENYIEFNKRYGAKLDLGIAPDAMIVGLIYLAIGEGIDTREEIREHLANLNSRLSLADLDLLLEIYNGPDGARYLWHRDVRCHYRQLGANSDGWREMRRSLASLE